jgi:hypothetical protein
MTKYERQLVGRLKDPTQWPDFEDPDFLNRLDAVAERALQKRSVEGNLAAVLIYHQLVEEMLRLIVQTANFSCRSRYDRGRLNSASRPSRRSANCSRRSGGR